MSSQNPKRIILTTDFSKSAANAYPYAVALARHFGAELTLLHTMAIHSEHLDGVHAVDVSEPYLNTVEADSLKKLNALDIGDISGVTVERKVTRASSAAAGVVGFAGEQKADLIVISSHGRRVLGQILLGSVTRAVIAEAPCPVLCVKEGESGMIDSASGKLQLKRVLAPSDLSEHSHSAVGRATQLAWEFKAELHLLHVVHFDVPDSIFLPPGRPSMLKLDSEMRQRVLDRLTPWKDEAVSAGVHVTLDVIEGAPPKEIARYADTHDIDLIVLCRRGNPDTPHFLGGVALRLLHETHRPMLVI